MNGKSKSKVCAESDRTATHWRRKDGIVQLFVCQKHGGDFLLRIEDTDSTRFVPGAEEYIVEALQWLGIQVDEGIGVDSTGPHAPYRQSERKVIYKQYVDQLLQARIGLYSF